MRLHFNSFAALEQFPGGRSMNVRVAFDIAANSD